MSEAVVLQAVLHEVERAIRDLRRTLEPTKDLYGDEARACLEMHDASAVVRIHRRPGGHTREDIERVQVWDQLAPLGDSRWRIQQLFNTANKGGT